MTGIAKVAVGAIVKLDDGRDYLVRRFETPTRVALRNMDTNETSVVPLENLRCKVSSARRGNVGFACHGGHALHRSCGAGRAALSPRHGRSHDVARARSGRGQLGSQLVLEAVSVAEARAAAVGELAGSRTHRAAADLRAGQVHGHEVGVMARRGITSLM